MHLKTDKVDLKKSHREKKKFCIFFQSTHQVGMKNVVKCFKHFFGYFNALETHSVVSKLVSVMWKTWTHRHWTPIGFFCETSNLVVLVLPIDLCFCIESGPKRKHSWFLEHWNSQKSLCNIRHRFSYLLDEWIEKICKKNFFHGGFFFKSTLSVLRCTWTGRINLKIFLGHHVNYLNIWPFFAYFFNPLIK